jgi:hypothetical protein
MRSSPHTITYSSLIHWAENQTRYAERRLSDARSKGVTNLEALIKDLECAKTAARLFKKCRPGQQAELFELFENIKK